MKPLAVVLALSFLGVLAFTLAQVILNVERPRPAQFKVVQGITTTNREDYDEFYEIANGKVKNQAISREMLLDRMQQEGWIYQGSHAAPGGFSDGEPAILETYIFKK